MMLKIDENIKEALKKGERIGQDGKIILKDGNAIISMSSKENIVFQAMFPNAEDDANLDSEIKLDKVVLNAINAAENDLNMTSKDNEILIESDGFTATLEEPKKIQEPTIEIKKGDLSIKFNIDEAKSVLYATSVLDSSPTLTGVCFKFYNGMLNIMATDTFRITNTSVNYEVIGNTEVEEGREFIIGKTQLQKILNVLDGEIVMMIADQSVCINKGNVLMGISTLSGKYLDIKGTLESIKTPNDVVVNKFELIDAVNKCSILNTNLIVLDISNSKINISSTKGKSIVQADIECTSKSSLICSVNLKYFLEFLNNFDEEELKISFVEGVNNRLPIRIKTEDKEAILLPIGDKKSK